MSFAVSIEPAAVDDLARMPATVQPHVLGEIRVLAAGPLRSKTRPARYPYPAGQLYQTQFRVGDVTCLLDIVFQYSQDEQTLHVLRVYIEYD